MKRLAWNTFCNFSLLVLAASVTIWVRSYYVGEDVGWIGESTDLTQQPSVTRIKGFGIEWAKGTVGIARFRREGQRSETTRQGWLYQHWVPQSDLVKTRTPNDIVNVQFGGIQLLHRVTASSLSQGLQQHVLLPLWLFLPFSIPPILWIRHHRRRGGRGFGVIQAEKTIVPPASDQHPPQ